MIRNFAHAEQVQARRYDAGKRGVSKAVRRFFKSYDMRAQNRLRAPIRWGGYKP